MRIILPGVGCEPQINVADQFPQQARRDGPQEDDQP